MQLSELTSGLISQTYNMRDTDIRSIEFDSRKVRPGTLYIAVSGGRYDGHDFVQDAERKGAAAVITQHKVLTTLPQIVVQDPRDTMTILAPRYYGDFNELTKIGVTGTNGKTTTAFLVHSILVQAEKKPGLIGTVYYLGVKKEKASRTTPEILDIYRLFKIFKDNAIDSVVMEVSSHALKLRRVEGLKFDAAVFTNLSQDHLDFHLTMDDYLHSKLHLFSLLKSDGYALYNHDDESRSAIENMSLAHKISFGRGSGSNIRGRTVEQSLDGLRVEVCYDKKCYDIKSPLIGGFNLYNILAAFAVGIALGIEIGKIIAGIETLKSVPGRMERVVDNVFVDYAHTPDAIENVLQAFRKYTTGRLIIVFGCGGNRDRDKRPKMGALAARLADEIVITSDNPRNEPTAAIISDILQGVTGNNHRVIEDRAEAIEYAIKSKGEQDIVIVAGKGHEEYQIINDEVIEFSDGEVIRKCFGNSC
jgi:UDP-N-acetylmuramoyl-L-alanyl-D-glutamate--2,6-diaminopimelate ligase